MTRLNLRRTLHLALSFAALLTLPLSAGAQAGTNASQQLTFAGLRSVAMQGQINAVKTDAAGNRYLLLNQGDGVRLLKTDSSNSTVLAQRLLGAAGDAGLAMAADPAGNLYVTGTSTSAALTATAGAAVTARTDNSTQSFVAKFDSNLNVLFVTFTGGSKIAASAVAATADAVFVTGTTFATNLPVTSGGIQQQPAAGSSGNGFVERFNSAGSTLVYSTYLTGSGGDTNPAAIAADAADNAYIAGQTSASGFPTTAALVPSMLGTPSGFLTRLAPAGDSFVFSTFVPGGGLTSATLDAVGTTLLVSGSISLGQFPVATVSVPVVQTSYQVLLRLPLDGSGVTSSTLLAPGSQSFAAAAADGSVWVDGMLGAPYTQALTTLADTGSIFAERVTAPGAALPNVVDQTARFGGLPNGNATFSSLPALATSVAVDANGSPLLGGAVEPTASASLLSSQTYDLPRRNAPTAAFPSSTADAAQTTAACNGSLCAGSAAYLTQLNPAANAPALAFSAGQLPLVVLRNLGSAPATGLAISTTSGNQTSNCGSTLAAGGQCDILLTGGTAGSLTATSAADQQTLAYPAYSAPASTLAFFPRELDFGIQTATSAAGRRTITVTNLGTAAQTFTSALDSSGKTASPFTEVASDCVLNGAITSKVLAAGATCHITLGFTATTAAGADAAQMANWLIGNKDVLLTGWSQAASVAVSAGEIDFGLQFSGGLRLPRYLYLSNSSNTAVSHTAAALAAGSPFALTDSCPASLMAGSVCRIRVDYLSSVVPSNDSATLTLDGGLQVLLTGQTQPPRVAGGATVNPNLTVTPASVSFSNAVPVTGVSGETQTVAIKNSGSAPFTLQLLLTGDFTDVTSCTGTLAGGATCAVVLHLVPAQPGVRQGLLSVTAGAGTTAQIVPISGTGLAILPANNGTLDQGSSPVGEPVIQFYKVSQPFNSLNVMTSGPFTAALIEDNGQGPGSPAASAFSAQVTGTCKNCYLAIRFTPTALGAQGGSVMITSDPAGSAYVLALTGNGSAVTGLVLTPTAVDFGGIPVHSSSGTQVFTVTNLVAGGAAVTLAAPVITGDYVLTQQATGSPACGGMLAYTSSCTVTLQFQPTATGTRAGSLSVSTGSTTATAALTGTGAADPGLAIMPLQLTFTAVPDASATLQTVTLTNTGATALQIGTPVSGSAQFQSTSNCTALAPGANCTLTVTFTPGSANVQSSLTIPVTGGQSASYTVTLAGNYTAGSAGLTLAPGVLQYGPQAVGGIGSTRLLTLTNSTARSFAVTVQVPRQYALASAPCTSLPASGSCSFAVTFTPLDAGDSPGTIFVSAVPSDGSSTLTTLSYAEGFGVGAGSLSITGELIVNRQYDFGQIASGQQAQRVFTVTNGNAAGTSALTVRRVTSAPPFFSTTSCGAALTPGQNCTVTVTYMPSNQVAIGTASPQSTRDTGSLVVESDAASSPDTLQLTGQAGPVAVASPGNAAVLATFTLSQGSLTFASTAVGNSAPAQTVTLTNTGTVTLHVLALGTTADFTVSSSCGTVAPGASCTFSVSSTPQTPGLHLASLEIATDAAVSLEFVTLQATATPAPLTLTPGMLNFGQVNLGSSSTLPVQVTNNSNAPVVFGTVSASGDYTAAGSCPAAGAALPAGASCTVQVAFSPTATGVRSGTLSVASSASTLPLTAALTGTGIQSRLQVTPSALQFGPLVLGASAMQTVTLTNAGTAAVTGLSFSITGDYSIAQPCGTTTLAVGASCAVGVLFQPTALGARNGSLTVRSSDPASPAVIPLTGTGIQNASFTLTVDGSASSTVSVKSGQPAVYHLTVTPVGTFSGTVALTCAGVNPAQYASCSFMPAMLTLNGSAQTSLVTLNTITSANRSAQLEHGSLPARDSYRAEKFLCLLLPGMYAVWRGRRRMRKSLALRLVLMLIGSVIVAAGCGSSAGDFDTRYVAPGNYVYQVTATSTSGTQITQTVTLNLTVTAR